MDDTELHSRAARIEKQIRNFRIVNPDGGVLGGFGELRLGGRDIGERISNIEKQLKSFRIIGGDGVSVAGSMGQGYAIEIKRGAGDAGPSSGFTGPTGPTGPPTGDCPSDISIFCDSISASATKCGFEPFSPSDTRVFLVRTVTTDVTTNPDNMFLMQHCVRTDTRTYDPSTCTFSDSASGPSCVVGAYAGCHYLPGTAQVGDCFVNSYTCPDAGTPRSEIGTVSTCYSDEYTTALLISTAEGNLADYDDLFTDTCSASRNLSMDETTYAITRFQYKFTFSAVANNFVLSWNEHTVFDDSSTGDTPMSTTVSAGSTETSIFECLEPEANGVTTITDVICTPA